MKRIREGRVEEVRTIKQEVRNIRKDEVREALNRMKNGMAVGPDDISVEVCKCLRRECIEFLTKFILDLGQ